MLTTKSDLVAALSGPHPDVLEACIAQSARHRFGDLVALHRVIELVEGFERQAASLAALIETIEIDGADRDDRLRSPVLRGWLSLFGRIEDWIDTNDARLCRQLDMTDNMRVSFADAADWTALLAIESGVIMTWDCQIAIGGVHGKLAGVRKIGRKIAIIDETGGRHDIDLDDLDDPRILRAPAMPGINVVIRNDLPWLRLKLREDRAPGRQDGVINWEFDDPMSYFPPTDPGNLLKAAAILETALSEKYDELGRAMRVVVPRKTTAHIGLMSFTSSAYQGACWVARDSVLDNLEDLIHELGHVTLRYLEETLPILEAEQTDELFKVDWRDDPRPIIGIFEGLYVHAKIAEALERVIAHGALDGADLSDAIERAAEVRREVAAGLEIMRRHGRFTEAGIGFLEWADAAITAPKARIAA
ncbi:HEXXH motif-containing protein [Sphingomonas sp. UYAg733]